jgi:nucleotide-binding universal stress UspA family protein
LDLLANILHIIAPTEFSAVADRAAERAALLASTLGGTLTLIHVLPPQELLEQIFPTSGAPEAESLRARAGRALNERAQRFAAQFGAAPACRLVHGQAHQAILEVLDSLGASIVVLGAQGEREGVPSSGGIGDTALKVAEDARVSTLLVRRRPREAYCRVVTCAKGSPVDRVVLDSASRMSPADRVHVVSAYSVPYEGRLIEWGASQATIDVYATRERHQRTRHLSEIIENFGLPPARARLHVERGEPVQTILRIVKQLLADLIVVSRRAQTRSLDAGTFSSFAGRIVRLTSMDVLIVPPSSYPPTD